MKKSVLNYVKNTLNLKILRQKQLLLNMALAGLLYVAGMQNGNAQIYTFSSGSHNKPPASVSAANGTAIVNNWGSRGKTMTALTIGSAKTAVFNMSLFPSASDYSVQWSEEYTNKPRRSGFLLRGSGSNSAHPGSKKGYLFQVNPALGKVRIYRSNSSGHTQLKAASLPATGTDKKRWYRATVKGNNLTFEYSDDGFVYITKKLITVTDNTYSKGTTQYCIGYGSGVGGSYIDGVKFLKK